jgi:hypothetical protein
LNYYNWLGSSPWDARYPETNSAGERRELAGRAEGKIENNKAEKNRKERDSGGPAVFFI